MILDDLVDLTTWSKHRLHFQPSQQLDLVKHIKVERVTGNHLKRAVFTSDGRKMVAINKTRRQRLDDISRDVHAGQVNHVEVKPLPHYLKKHLFGNRTVLNQSLVQA